MMNAEESNLQKMDEIELGRPPSSSSSTPPVKDNQALVADSGALDQILDNTNLVCCLKSTEKAVEVDQHNSTENVPDVEYPAILDEDEDAAEDEVTTNETALMTESPKDHFAEPPLLDQRSDRRVSSFVPEAYEIKAEFSYDDETMDPSTQAGVASGPVSKNNVASNRGGATSISRSSTASSAFPTPEIDYERESVPDDEPVETTSYFNGSRADKSVAGSRASTASRRKMFSALPAPEIDFEREASCESMDDHHLASPVAISRSTMDPSSADDEEDVSEAQSRAVSEIDLSTAYSHQRDEEMAYAIDNKRDRSAVDSSDADEVSAAPDSVTAKDMVEIQAHFDGDEATLMSDNAQNTTADEAGMIGMFLDDDSDEDKGVSTKQRAPRRKILLLGIALILVLILIAALSGGLATRKNKSKEESRSFAAGQEIEAETGGQGEPSFGDIVSQPTSDEPTSNQTDEPVDEAVTAPPTACIDTISADFGCYRYLRDQVSVSFSICNPTSQDWVALYPVDTDKTRMPYPDNSLWQYSCGGQTCDGIVASDVISMGFATPEGRYQAFLFSNEGGDQGAPYVATAASDIFVITPGTCD